MSSDFSGSEYCFSSMKTVEQQFSYDNDDQNGENSSYSTEYPEPSDINQYETKFEVKEEQNDENQLYTNSENKTDSKEINAKIEASLECENWSEKKSKSLKTLTLKCKYDWKKIAKKFNTDEKTNFSPLFLRQKYKDITKNTVPLRVKFTHEEDLMIAKYFETYGCNWSQIATHFTARSPIMIKNRYYSHIRKRNLLPSMLQQVNETKQEELTLEKIEESDNQSCETLSVQNFDGFGVVINFSMRNFLDAFYEIENALTPELYDRITLMS